MLVIGMSLALALVTASPALADPFADFGNGSISFVKAGSQWQKALFICDGVDAPQVLVFGYPAASGATTLARYAGGAWSSQALTLADGEPGAGQIVYPFSGASTGAIHALNPAMVEGATSPTVSSVTLGAQDTTCRWAPGTVIFAVTPQRTILVTATPTGYQYQAFALAKPSAPVRNDTTVSTVPTLTINGTGTVMTGDYVAQTYSFTNGEYSYRIDIGGPTGQPGGTLTVLQGGKAIATEPFAAYTLNGM